MILRLNLVRPSTIVPGPVHYKMIIGWRDKPVVWWYRYQWSDDRQSGFEEWSLPTYDCREQGLQIGWRSEPTAVQSKYIADGNLEVGIRGPVQRMKLPFTT